MVVQFLPFPCYGDNTVEKMQKNGMKDMYGMIAYNELRQAAGYEVI